MASVFLSEKKQLELIYVRPPNRICDEDETENKGE